MQNIIVSSSHDEISMATVPFVSLRATPFSMYSADSKKSPDDYPGASTQDALGKDGRPKDIRERETCASDDERPDDHSEAYSWNFAKTYEIRCILRQIDKILVE